MMPDKFTYLLNDDNSIKPDLDIFTILKINPEEITSLSPEHYEKHFRKLALECHPDKNQNEKRATIAYQIIQEAITIFKTNHFSTPKLTVASDNDWVNAIKNNQLDLFRKKLEDNKDINLATIREDFTHNSLLMLCITYKRREMVDMFLKDYLDLNMIQAQNRWGDTAFILASHHNDILTVSKILEHYSKNLSIINARYFNHETSLMVAARRGHTTIVKLILEKCSHHDDIINAFDNRNCSILEHAVKGRNIDCVRLILELLAKEPNRYFRLRDSLSGAFSQAISQGEQDKNIVNLFFELFPNDKSLLKSPHATTGTPLIVAAFDNRTDVLQMCIDKKLIDSDVLSFITHSGNTVYHIAAQFGIEFLDLLVQHFPEHINPCINHLGESVLQLYISNCNLSNVNTNTFAALLRTASGPELLKVHQRYPTLKNNTSHQNIYNLFHTYALMETHLEKINFEQKSKLVSHIEELKHITSEYLSKGNKQELTQQFTGVFQKIIPLTSPHRKLWKPLLFNILIAATGIGLIALVVHFALQRKLGFFSQTERKNIADTIQTSFNNCMSLGG